MKKEKVSVIGGGAWGTAIANHLAQLGYGVTLWVYEKEVADDINSNHLNSLFLKGVELSLNIKATNNIADACEAGIIFFIVPSHIMEGVVKQMVPHLQPDTIVVSCTKGIETKGLRLPSQIFDELLPKDIAKKLVCFSGPSFAFEVAKGLPTAITASSGDIASAVAVQNIVKGRNMMVFTNSDTIGVEVGAVVKNVIAIAAGISDGLNFGHNSRAAIITRGLEEAVRLGVAMGADEKTFRGLSGMGDMILTASGDLSRNRTVGLRLGRGESLEEITGSMVTVAEGVKTSEAIEKLSKKVGVELAICSEVYKVCHEGKNPAEAAKDLIGMDFTTEFDG